MYEPEGDRIEFSVNWEDAVQMQADLIKMLNRIMGREFSKKHHIDIGDGVIMLLGLITDVRRELKPRKSDGEV